MDARDPCPELDESAWGVFLGEDQAALANNELSLELRHKLLRRLQQAWNSLNYQYLGSKLQPPTLELMESERRWGCWDPHLRRLRISLRQVLCYTWESALETLKHEVAHQVVSELWGEPPEPAHGPSFQRACGLLACDSAARGDGGTPLFRPGGPGPQATREDRRLARIQKLLALADNNPDEHEARAAFARAGELMLKYNLDPQAQGPRDYVHRFLGKSSGRVPLHHYQIATILELYFFVECIWVDSYVVRTGVAGSRLEVSGTPANVDMAEYVYTCLLRQCDQLWRHYKRTQGITDRRAKRQYLDGLMSGFREQLRTTRAQNQERGLVWVGDPALERFFRKRHPRISRSRLGGVEESAVHAAGREAGARMRLHRPMGSSASAGVRGLLPG